MNDNVDSHGNPIPGVDVDGRPTGNVGAGNVGATTAQRIFDEGYADVVLIDILEVKPILPFFFSLHKNELSTFTGLA